MGYRGLFQRSQTTLGLPERAKQSLRGLYRFHPLNRIRFCLLVIAKQTQGAASIALMRQKLCSNSTDISFASKLWQVFRAVIAGALDELRAVLGDVASLVMETIDTHIQCLFTQVLQLDHRTLRLEAL